jgi:hypothetical protein
MTTLEKLFAAVPLALEELERQFPTAVAKLRETFGIEISTSLVTSLQADPALVAQTETETSIAEIVKVIAPAIMGIAVKLML